ncbi:MAG: metallophosphoesterase [Verrucomicrobia bacterium]|nr:metallophosphoesterase [Verrucomicrobiota bacterium]
MKSAFQRTTKTETELKGVRQIVVVGDVGCTGFGDLSKQVFGAVLRHQADLFMITGDLAHTGATEQLTEVIDFCNTRTQKPVFALCGNHDLPGYAECCGLSTYAIVLQRVVLVCLDNSKGSFEPADLEFLRHQLQKHDGKRFVVLFHVPPPLESIRSVMKEDAWHELRRVLDSHKSRIDCIICGHLHGFHEYHLDGYHIFITAGGGAAMIYQMPKEECKTFNALRLAFKDDGSIAIEMIPIQV